MRANEQHPPAIGSYHALLQTQIYDYFIYYGLSDCAQALLSSDCIMQHKGVNSASPHCADGPYDTTPSLPDSSFQSLLGGGAVIGNHDGLEAHQGQPPILYQWFTTFWDVFNPYHMDAGVLPPHDGFNLSQDQIWEPVQPQQILYGDINNIPPLSFAESLPLEVKTLRGQSVSSRQLSPYSDTTTRSRDTSHSSVSLLSFQKDLDELLAQNQAIVKKLRARSKDEAVFSQTTFPPQPAT